MLFNFFFEKGLLWSNYLII